MEYTWESEKIILVPMDPHRVKKGDLLSATWEQKSICRTCKGRGCRDCLSLGYYTKKLSQALQVVDNSNVANGAWYRFTGVGDERPDYAVFGDVILLIHIIHMSEPSGLDPTLEVKHNQFFSSMGSTGGAFNGSIGDIFSDFFGTEALPPAINAKIRISKDEARHGCTKELDIKRTKLCDACKGQGKLVGSSESCRVCNDAGVITEDAKVKVDIRENVNPKERLVLKGVGNAKIMDGAERKGNVIVTLKIKRWML